MSDWQHERAKAIQTLQVPLEYRHWPEDERAALLAAAEKLMNDEEHQIARLVAQKPGAASGFARRRRDVREFLAEIRRLT